MHKINGLIMAGGKSTRIKELGEKPLIPLHGRPLIDYVQKAMMEATLIKKIYIAVSPHTTKTLEYLKEKTRNQPVQIIQTPGIDYVEDLRYAINNYKLSNVLVCPADTPLLRGEMLDQVIKKFFETGKPSLVTVVPFKLTLSLGLKPTTIMEINNTKMVPTGINVIKGEEMKNGTALQEEYFKVNIKEFAVNINTKKDLKTAEKLLNKPFHHKAKQDKT
ncbi:MAG: NTP transferase domain-containing protein [Candidatus Jordarchaeaceae archaeon]